MPSGVSTSALRGLFSASARRRLAFQASVSGRTEREAVHPDSPSEPDRGRPCGRRRSPGIGRQMQEPACTGTRLYQFQKQRPDYLLPTVIGSGVSRETLIPALLVPAFYQSQKRRPDYCFHRSMEAASPASMSTRGQHAQLEGLRASGPIDRRSLNAKRPGTDRRTGGISSMEVPDEGAGENRLPSLSYVLFSLCRR